MSKVLYTFFVGTCAFLCLGIVLCTTPVVAKNDGHGRDGDKERSRHNRDHDEDEHGRSGAQGYHHSNHGIHDSDAYIIRKYLTDNHHRRCPPGLAKKRNGCLPPGIAKKYAVGQVLNDGIWSPVPEALRLRLNPRPGHYYALIDNDVVLVAEASKKIIDAVTLLSAVR